jgi:hypothetical protein
MHPIRKKILADEANRPVAVQIDYADWLEVEKLLGLTNSPVSNGTHSAPTIDLNTFAGTLPLREDPIDFQRRVRDEWP